MIVQRVGLPLALVGLAGLGAGLLLADSPLDRARQANGAASALEDPPTRLAGTVTNGASVVNTDAAGQWLDDAEALMADRRFAEAGALLSAGVGRMPDGWQPIGTDRERVVLAAWDLGEFLRFSKDSDPLAEPGVVWVTPSYSKAYYLLAVIGVETGDAESAVNNMARAIEVQPYHPLVMHEAALILQRMGGAAQALEVLDHVDRVPAWLMTPERRALLWRTRGVTLVELGRLDEAEAALRASLDPEPNSAIARRELDYIAELRAQGAAAREPMVLTPRTQDPKKR
jgi:tetratricopeptide (TPR) repeat protein